MNGQTFHLSGVLMTALPSGALWLPGAGLLCVSDLHLGKSDRIARRLGLMLPPYEVAATLDRLDADLAATRAATVICLGDSFDDLAAADSLTLPERLRLTAMQAGRRWIWIEGNHDSGPVDLGGTHLADYRDGPLTFRHIAEPEAEGEVSGHYHPKTALPGAGASRPCFVTDGRRLILPAYGAYTGGLSAATPVLRDLFGDRAVAILTGRRCLTVPLPRPDPDRGARRPGLRGRSG
jgi:DNA ligase-associated metallophosphoesterase